MARGPWREEHDGNDEADLALFLATLRDKARASEIGSPPHHNQEKAKIEFTCWLRNTGALVQKSMASRWRPRDYEGDGYQYLLIHASVYAERNLIKRLLDSFFQSY